MCLLRTLKSDKRGKAAESDIDWYANSALNKSVDVLFRFVFYLSGGKRKPR